MTVHRKKNLKESSEKLLESQRLLHTNGMNIKKSIAGKKSIITPYPNRKLTKV